MKLKITGDWSKYHSHLFCPGAESVKRHFDTPYCAFGDNSAFVCKEGIITLYSVDGFIRGQDCEVTLTEVSVKPVDMDRVRKEFGNKVIKPYYPQGMFTIKQLREV